MNSREHTRTAFLEAVTSFIKEKSTLTKCHACNSPVRMIKNSHFVVCKRQSCRKKFSLLNNVEIKNSKLPFGKLFELIYCIIEDFNTKNISNFLDICRPTVLKYRNVLKNVLKEKFKKEEMQIGGRGIIVEVDESLIGRRKYNRGREVRGVWIFGLVERTPARRVIMVKVKKRDKTTLISKIIQYVVKGSIIMSDKWGGYIDVELNGYEHRTVNHSTNFVDPETGAHTQTIESTGSA